MAKRILIIDDDAILASLLRLTFELEGYDASVADDGAAGLRAITTERFDLILLDLVMPNVDGIKFLRLLNERNVVRPPIMILSSAIEEKLTQHFRTLGVVDIARKPLEPAELVKRVKSALSKGAVPPSARNASALEQQS